MTSWFVGELIPHVWTDSCARRWTGGDDISSGEGGVSLRPMVIAAIVGMLGCTAGRTGGPASDVVSPLPSAAPRQLAAVDPEPSLTHAGVSQCPVLLRHGADTTLILLQRTTRIERRDTVGAMVKIRNVTLLGDYSVADPRRFGMGRDELLRLDCLTMKALGLVKDGTR